MVYLYSSDLQCKTSQHIYEIQNTTDSDLIYATVTSMKYLFLPINTDD